MKFEKEKWETCYKQAAKELPEQGSSDGIVCIRATILFMHEGLKADKIAAGKSLMELWESVNKAKTLSGFASNASAAAKACELNGSPKERAMVGMSLS